MHAHQAHHAALLTNRCLPACLPLLPLHPATAGPGFINIRLSNEWLAQHLTR
jgi:hypothetical protein